MQNAFRLYFHMLGFQIRSQMQYRLSFFLETLATGLGTGITFLTLVLVFQRFEQIAGWHLGEVALLYGMVETAFGLTNLLFSGFEPSDFGERVRLGSFDQMLLRPVGVVLQVLGSRFTLRRLGRLGQGLLVLAYAIRAVDLHLSVPLGLYMVLVILSMVAFFGGIFIAGAGITFWTVGSIEVVNIFTYGGAEMMAYPMSIYQDWLRKFFTFILPVIFLNYYPALFILGKPDPFAMPPWVHLVAPLAGLGVLCVSLVFWRFALEHYQSTGT